MNTIETPAYRVTLGEDDIIRVVVKGESITLKISKQGIDAVTRLSQGRRLPMLVDARLTMLVDARLTMLVDARLTKSMSRPARVALQASNNARRDF